LLRITKPAAACGADFCYERRQLNGAVAALLVRWGSRNHRISIAFIEDPDGHRIELFQPAEQ
jgi:catechol 2,3-dioxygenase-like lactoylglutathione lyase family enzyme